MGTSKNLKNSKNSTFEGLKKCSHEEWDSIPLQQIPGSFDIWRDRVLDVFKSDDKPVLRKRLTFNVG